MSILDTKLLAIVLIICAGFAGAWLPWRIPKSENIEFWFSLGNAFAGGVFLALGFIHMLGDAASLFASSAPQVQYPVPFLLAGCTFMGLLLVERIIAPHSFDEVQLADEALQPKDNSTLAAYILLLTLSIHSILAGLALGLQSTLADTWVILVALLAHKGVAAFALSVSLFRTGKPFNRCLVYIALFCLTTPLGILAGTYFIAFFSGHWREMVAAIFNAMAAGTFIYIASLDIFSEEFLRTQFKKLKYLITVIP